MHNATKTARCNLHINQVTFYCEFYLQKFYFILFFSLFEPIKKIMASVSTNSMYCVFCRKVFIDGATSAIIIQILLSIIIIT